MSAKVTEYFYTLASTIGQKSDQAVFSLLSNGEFMKAHDQADDAYREFKSRGNDSETAAAMITCAEVCLVFDEVDQAHTTAEEALAKAEKIGSDKLKAAALNVIAKATTCWGAEEAIVSSKAALAVAEASGDLHMRACVHCTLGSAYVAAGQGNQAIAEGHKLQSLFSSGNDAIGEACALLCLSEFQVAAGNHKAAVDAAKDAARILKGTGDEKRHALAKKFAAAAALSSEEYAADGWDLATEALALLEAAKDSKGQITLKLDMAHAKLRQEAYIEAEDLAEEAQKASQETGDLANEAESCQILATVRLAIAVEDAKEQDEPDCSSATEASREALVLFRKLGNRSREAAAMHKLAQVRYHARAYDMAKMAAEEAQAMFREWGDVSGEAGAVLLIAHVMHQESQLDNARRTATKASTLYQSIGDKEGANTCEEFLQKVGDSQTKKTRETKAATKSVSDTGLVKLVNSSQDATHLLSFLAEMNDEEDTELSEFDLSKWNTTTLKMQAMQA